MGPLERQLAGKKSLNPKQLKEVRELDEMLSNMGPDLSNLGIKKN